MKLKLTLGLMHFKFSYDILKDLDSTQIRQESSSNDLKFNSGGDHFLSKLNLKKNGAFLIFYVYSLGSLC